MTPDELQEGRRLEAAATKGPWQLCGKDQTEVLALDGTPESIIVVDTRFFVEQTNPNEKEDAAFIAWMRNNAAALLAAADALREARGALQPFIEIASKFTGNVFHDREVFLKAKRPTLEDWKALAALASLEPKEGR